MLISRYVALAMQTFDNKNPDFTMDHYFFLKLRYNLLPLNISVHHVCVVLRAR